MSYRYDIYERNFLNIQKPYLGQEIPELKLFKAGENHLFCPILMLS